MNVFKGISMMDSHQSVQLVYPPARTAQIGLVVQAARQRDFSTQIPTVSATIKPTRQSIIPVYHVTTAVKIAR